MQRTTTRKKISITTTATPTARAIVTVEERQQQNTCIPLANEQKRKKKKKISSATNNGFGIHTCGMRWTHDKYSSNKKTKQRIRSNSSGLILTGHNVWDHSVQIAPFALKKAQINFGHSFDATISCYKIIRSHGFWLYLHLHLYLYRTRLVKFNNIDPEI